MSCARCSGGAMSSVGGLLEPLPAPLPRQRGDASAPMICSQVFDSISIHANGDIVRWCVDMNGQRIYGNVFKDRIADVWDGPAYREIREWLPKLGVRNRSSSFGNTTARADARNLMSARVTL